MLVKLDKLKENGGALGMLLLWIITTLFFILQHFWNITWDFSAYVINAEYLFYRGDYFEVYRAPLISVFLGLFMIFGNLGEYIYLIFTTTLFLYANLKLSEVLYEKKVVFSNISKSHFQLIFYLFSLNIFLLLHGLTLGTELLGLAFFELFLAFYIKNRISGHFLALAILSRYNFLLFAPLLLINNRAKKTCLNLLALIITILPWLIYNRIKWGNYLTSIIDSYHLNVISRSGITEPLQLTHFLSVGNWMAPLAIIGLAIIIHQALSHFTKKKDFPLYGILFLLIVTIIIYDYAAIPFKISRYLFTLTLPIAFFSAIAYTSLLSKSPKIKLNINLIIIIITIISLLSAFIIAYEMRHNDEIFKNAAQTIKNLNLEECSIYSPHWVPVNYYTKNVYYLDKINSVLDNNGAVLIFKCCPTIDDTFDINNLTNYPVLLNDEEKVILANQNFSRENCAKRYGKDKPMVSNTCEFISQRLEKFSLRKIAKKICLILNKN